LDKWFEANSVDPQNILVIGDQFVDAELAGNICARALLVERNGETPHLEDRGTVMFVNNFDDVELV
jgi:phosphoglycolate phosphatase-like HAD superfamily hydrolase